MKQSRQIYSHFHFFRTILIIVIAAQFALPATVVSYVKDAGGAVFSLSNGKLRIGICANKIVRVWFTPADTFPSQEYFAVAETTWTALPFSVNDSVSDVEITTTKLKISVEKATVKVRFFTVSGTLILEESAADQWSANQGTSSFNSASSEALYGLGNQTTVGTRGQGWAVQHGNTHKGIPVVVSSKGYGLFFAGHSNGTWQDNTSTFSFVQKSVDDVQYYFMYGPELDSVIACYREITGAAPLLPKSVYGYIQSKNTYAVTANWDTCDLYTTAKTFRDKGIPVDWIVRDYMWQTLGGRSSGSFEWTIGNSNAQAMVKALHDLHIEIACSIWPNYDGTGTYANKTSMQNADNFVSTSFVDVSKPAARDMYFQQSDQGLGKLGIDGYWLDACEPEGCNWQADMGGVPCYLGNSAKYGMLYPLLDCRGIYENWRKQYGTAKRVSTLSRALYAGQQRYGCYSWSGDIQNGFASLKSEIAGHINVHAAGYPYYCSDIGGYFSNSPLSSTSAEFLEAFTRWVEFSTFNSIMRVHGQAPERHPWSFDAAHNAILTSFIKLRYRLMPYIYSLAHMVTANGYTMMRGLAFDFRQDPSVLTISDQFMFGPALLVSPVTTSGATSRSLYLPQGSWYDFWTGAKQTSGGAAITANAPIDYIPVYARAGSIIPCGPEIQYAMQRSDTIELRIYPGANGSFTLYEDEGDNYNYENGAYSIIPITYVDNPQNVIIGARSGSFIGMDQKKIFNIVYVKGNHGVGEAMTAIPDCQIIYTGTQASCTAAGVTHLGNFIDESRYEKPYSIVNAASDYFTCGKDVGAVPKTIFVYDLSGRLIITKTMTRNIVELQKDLGIQEGVYIVKVRRLGVPKNY